MNLGVRLPLQMSFLVSVNSNFASLPAFSFVPEFPVDIHHGASLLHDIDGSPGPEVIKLEYSLRLEIKHNDWLLADTCPQVANHCALF